MMQYSLTVNKKLWIDNLPYVTWKGDSVHAAAVQYVLIQMYFLHHSETKRVQKSVNAHSTIIYISSGVKS